MASIAELGERLRSATHKQIRSRQQYAIMGRVRANGSLTLNRAEDGTRLPNNKIYVRINGDAAQTREVWAVNVGVSPGLACFVEEDPRGELRIVALDDKMATEFMGSYAPSFASPPKDTEATQDTVISGYGIRPGRMIPVSESDLRVQVMPFWYGYLDSLKYWANTTYVDLTDYLPASSGAWCWVWVGIDPKNNTITARASEEVSLQQLLTPAVLAEVDMSGLIPCDAVKVQEGQTAFSSSKNEILYARAFNGLPNPIVPNELGTGLIGAGRTLNLSGDITYSGDLTIKGIIAYG